MSTELSTNKKWTQLITELKQTKALNLIGPVSFNHKLVKNLPTIFVDGGVNYKKDLSHLCFSNIAIGDGDSSHSVDGLDIVLPREKDFTDFTFCLNQLPDFEFTVYLYGFVGGALDHYLASLASIYRFLSSQLKPVTFVSETYVFYPKGTYFFEHFGQFSILSFENTDIEIKGQIKYEVFPKKSFPIFSCHTISNQAHGAFSIIADKPFLYILRESE